MDGGAVDWTSSLLHHTRGIIDEVGGVKQAENEHFCWDVRAHGIDLALSWHAAQPRERAHVFALPSYHDVFVIVWSR